MEETTKPFLQRVLISSILFCITAYRYLISPCLGQNCRYYPSCSEYAAAVIAKQGFICGGWRAMCRILRCHPWHPGGYDPP